MTNALSTDFKKRLAAESLLPLTLFDRTFRRYLDIGSGGGMPALPLMLAGVIEGTAILVERTRKKAPALRRILVGLDLDAQVIAEPFEDNRSLGSFDLITMRLVRLVEPLLRRVVAALAPGGLFIYYGQWDVECDGVNVVSYSYSEANVNHRKHFAILQKM